MNATRTTLRQALPCWQRRTVRAVLLMGALAGMTLVSAAHAQIAFRSSSSASISGGAAIPALRAAAAGGPPMTIVGESRMPASDDAITKAASASITPPTGMQNKDVILLFVSAMVPSSTTISNTVSGGQTWGWSLGGQVGSNPTIRVFKTIFNGTWSANPTFSWGATAVTYQMWMIVLRGADTLTAGTQPVNDNNCCGGSNWLSGTFTAPASPFNVTIPGTFTTSTDNAMVFAHWGSADDNTWSLQSPGWSQPGGQPQWRTMAVAGSAGADSSLSIAYFTQATAGPVAAVTNQQASPPQSPASDLGGYGLFAVRPGGIRKPPGTVAGDVMIASIAFGLNTNVVTPPAGWTLVRRIDQASGTAYSLVIYRRVADASDASVSSYVFGLSNPNNGWVGGIQSFSGVDTTTPIDVENGQLTASSTTHATPTVTTTGANRLIVTTHMVSNGNVTGWTAPAGMTETLDFRWGNALIGAVATSTVLQATAGPSGTKTATIAGATGYTGAAHILALRPASGGGSNTLTIAKPAGVAQNDVLIASISVGPSTVTITPPAGWALVRRMDQAGGTSNSLAVYKLLAGASEPASYDWTFSAGHTGAAGGIQAFSGADPVIAIAEENGQNTSGTAHATPSVNATYSNTMIITSYGVGATSTWTMPAGMNETADAQGGSQAFEMNWVLQAAPASGISKTATSSSTGYGNAHILALRRVLGSFNAFETSTAAGAITGVIKTKLAGTSASAAVVALNAAKSAVATTYVGTMRVEILDASDNSAAIDADGCRSTWTVIPGLTQDMTFTAADNGRKNLSGTISNAYRNVRLRMTSPAGAPDSIGCSTDNFAVRPPAFTSVTSNMTNSGTSGTSVTAGGNFTITADAVAGYNGTPTIDNTKITAHAGAVQTGSVAGSFGAATPATGTATGSTFTYSEVGNFTIGVNGVYDSTFTAVDAPGTECTNDFSNTLVGGSYGCSFGNSVASAAVGRFTPDHFIVTLGTLTNRQALGCAASTYTYEGEQLRVTFALTARNGLGTPAITQNYTTASGFAKLDGTVYANFGFGAVDLADATPPLAATALTARVASGTSSGTWVGGSGSFTVDLAVSRASPDGPFESFRLGVLPLDLDGVTLRTADLNLDTSVPADSNDRILLGSSKIRFGRLALRNASGSQLVRLPVSLETQYWNGTAFITNDADNCTTLATNNVAMSNFTSNLAACETANTAVSAFARGRSILTLAAPGSANNGSVDLAVNLGLASSGTTCTSVGPSTVPAAGANGAYLQGNWTGGLYNVNPSARATFGVYKGSDEVIFIRENF